MKIKKGYALRSIAGENIVVPVGSKNIDFKGMITLNDSGAFLWRLLETEKTQEELLSAMLQEYDIDESAAEEDLKEFIDMLNNAGILV